MNENKTPERMAIAILIDLAQNGEINPWDVDVIRVVDRFLSELGLLESEAQSAATPADLPQSGQAFLWASMLVLLKADTLQQQELELPIEPEPDYDESQTTARLLPNRLEKLLRRRAAAPRIPKRRVTLAELIEQIEHIAQEINREPTTRPKRQISRKQAIEAITQLAHAENLTELAAGLQQLLSERTCTDSEAAEIDLEQLLVWWRDHQITQSPSTQASASEDSDHKLDRVGVFWALLLLASQSKVELSQEKFYQDLTIKPLAPAHSL